MKGDVEINGDVGMEKKELIQKIQDARDAIAMQLESISEERMNAVMNTAGWSIKTLIAHLTFWERATLDCRSGFTATESLKNISALNAELVVRTNKRSPFEVVREFQEKGKVLIEEISVLTEEDLQRAAPWNDGKTLAEHIADDTFVHYQEHDGKLKEWCAG